jgi:hypothetical protein
MTAFRSRVQETKGKLIEKNKLKQVLIDLFGTEICVEGTVGP